MDHILSTKTGQRLHLVHTPGRKTATGVLVVHGRGDTVDGYVPRILRRAAGRLSLPVVAVDLPGHGGSGGTFADFVFSDAVQVLEHVVAWMRHLGMVRIAFIGHSLGAALGVALSARKPAVNPLILVASPVHIREGFLAKYSPVQLQSLPQRGFAEYVNYLGQVVRQNKPFFDDLRSVDLLADAAKVRVPVLLAYGSRERLIPSAHGRQIFRALSDGPNEFALLQGADHDFRPPHAQRLEGLVYRYLRRMFVPSFSPVVNVVLQRPDGKLLFVYRSRGLTAYSGIWHSVSGFIDHGLTPVQQAFRELEQETGIRRVQVRYVRQGQPYFLDDPTYARRWKIHSVLLRVRGRAPRPRLNWEHTAYRWVPVDGLRRMKLMPEFDRTLKGLGLL